MAAKTNTLKDKTVAGVGRIENYRLKAVDIEEKWYLLKLSLSATGIDARTLTTMAKTCVILGIAPHEDAGKLAPLVVTCRLDDYRCRAVDASEKYYDIDISTPTSLVDGNALTAIALLGSDITLTPSQEELPFGGDAKGKGKARGKSRNVTKDKDQESMDV